MKIRYIISVLFALSCVHNSRAQENYQINNAKDTIFVSGDCEIKVSDFAPDGIDIYGDGDKGGVGRDKQDLFNQKTEKLNQGNVHKGITFQKKESGEAVIKVKYSELNTNTTLNFYAAKMTTKTITTKNGINTTIEDWNPDKSDTGTFSVTIIKQATDESAMSGSVPAVSDLSSLTNDHFDKTDKDSLAQEIDKLKGKSGNSFDITNILVWIAIVALLVLSILLFVKNRKDLGALAKEISGLEKEMKNLISKMNEQAQERLRAANNEKAPEAMSRPEIQRFIVEQIKYFRAQQVQNPIEFQKQDTPVKQDTPIKEEIEKVTLQSRSLNTDQVKYHEADMPYFSLESIQTPIFKIYAQGEDYYYTIVDDPSIREEIVGMIQGYEGCLTYQTAPGMAKRIEPVSPGKLRRDGDKFYVDVNNKLVVKYV